MSAEALRDLGRDLQVLRDLRPEFNEVADVLVALAADDSVSPAVFDQVCRAVFVVLEVWLEDS